MKLELLDPANAVRSLRHCAIPAGEAAGLELRSCFANAEDLQVESESGCVYFFCRGVGPGGGVRRILDTVTITWPITPLQYVWHDWLTRRECILLITPYDAWPPIRSGRWKRVTDKRAWYHAEKESLK